MRRQGRDEAVVSVIIATVLGLQMLAVLNPFLGILNERDGYLWPFLDYPMYYSAHHPGEPVNHFVLVGLLADGSEQLIRPADLGLDPLQFFDGPVAAVRSVDRASLRVFLDHDERRRRQALVAVRLENRPVALGAHGLEAGPVQVVRTVDLGATKRVN